MNEFYDILKSEPAWLSGVVFGPQVRDSLPVLRAKVPKRYRIRHYPDITHSLRSQYPVQDWDVAHALTSQREQINPRPEAQAVIFRSLLPYAPDFITYSEGANDDVNKFVWSGLGWDPKADVVQILREYSRYFIGERYADPFAQGLLALERQLAGPARRKRLRLHHARAVPGHGAHGRAARPAQLAVPAGALPRVLRRVRAQPSAPRDGASRSARSSGCGPPAPAIRGTRWRTPPRSWTEAQEKPAAEWRQRVYTLAEALFQSIRQQLSVEQVQRHRGRTRRHARQPRDAA